ncbi:MAG: RidA family protein [Desulfobulbus sp.]
MNTLRNSAVAAVILIATTTSLFATERKKPMKPSVEHINPPELYVNPAFSQAVKVATGSGLIFIGGQNSVDKSGKIVSPGDIGGQTRQAIQNVKVILDSQNVPLANVIK